MVIKLTLFAQVKCKDFYLYLLPEYNTLSTQPGSHRGWRRHFSGKVDLFDQVLDSIWGDDRPDLHFDRVGFSNSVLPF